MDHPMRPEAPAPSGTELEDRGPIARPSLHEAIGHEESNEHPEDTVVTEVRRGYRLNDRVVRPALVRVARPVGD